MVDPLKATRVESTVSRPILIVLVQFLIIQRRLGRKCCGQMKTKSSFWLLDLLPCLEEVKYWVQPKEHHPHCEVQRWKHYAQDDQFMGLWAVKSWMRTSFLKPERWRWVWMSLPQWQPRRSTVGSFRVLASLQTSVLKSVGGAKASSYQVAIKNPKGAKIPPEMCGKLVTTRNILPLWLTFSSFSIKY